MHMAHIVREMRGVAPTANGFFFSFSGLTFSATAAHGQSHTQHRGGVFQRLKTENSPPPPWFCVVFFLAAPRTCVVVAPVVCSLCPASCQPGPCGTPVPCALCTLCACWFLLLARCLLLPVAIALSTIWCSDDQTGVANKQPSSCLPPGPF
jgi:hypothetical protein